jgi:hypothetical protein
MASMAIRIPNDMKKEMARLKINWSHYLRQSISEAIESEKKRAIIGRIHKYLKNAPLVKSGTSARIIRHLRDHG